MVKTIIKPTRMAAGGFALGQVEEARADGFRLRDDPVWYRFRKHETKYEPPAVGSWVEVTAGHSRHVITLEPVEAERAEVTCRLFFRYPVNVLDWMKEVAIPAFKADATNTLMQDLPDHLCAELLAWRKTHRLP